MRCPRRGCPTRTGTPSSSTSPRSCSPARGTTRSRSRTWPARPGVTRPLIYQHHGSKEGLFIAAARRARDEFEASILAAHHDVRRRPVDVRHQGRRPAVRPAARPAHPVGAAVQRRGRRERRAGPPAQRAALLDGPQDRGPGRGVRPRARRGAPAGLRERDLGDQRGVLPVVAVLSRRSRGPDPGVLPRLHHRGDRRGAGPRRADGVLGPDDPDPDDVAAAPTSAGATCNARSWTESKALGPSSTVHNPALRRARVRDARAAQRGGPPESTPLDGTERPASGGTPQGDHFRAIRVGGCGPRVGRPVSRPGRSSRSVPRRRRRAVAATRRCARRSSAAAAGTGRACRDR